MEREIEVQAEKFRGEGIKNDYLAENGSNPKTENQDVLVVYLILAHEDPEFLARQITALDNKKVRFFVHVDAKSDLKSFMVNVSMKGRVTFIGDRVEVYWGGFSMVKATLHLMAAAINEVSSFKYAVLLSGVHYPIKANDYILKMLQSSDSEYLQYAKVSEVGCESKINAFCFNDHKLFNHRTVYLRNRRMNELMRMPGKLADVILKKLVPIVYKRKLSGGVIPYTGVNWWALTNPCVRYVLKYVEENKSYAKYFRFASQPDETFFHTIVCNSDFKLANQNVTLGSLIGNNTQKGKYSQLRGLSLTFTKCSQDGNPKVLDEGDFTEIKKELNYFGFPQLFARKFDSKHSSVLVRLIEDLRKMRV